MRHCGTKREDSRHIAGESTGGTRSFEEDSLGRCRGRRMVWLDDIEVTLQRLCETTVWGLGMTRQSPGGGQIAALSARMMKRGRELGESAPEQSHEDDKARQGARGKRTEAENLLRRGRCAAAGRSGAQRAGAELEESQSTSNRVGYWCWTR